MTTQSLSEVPGKQFLVQTFHSFSEVESFRTAWNELVQRSGADIYQTFEWCSIWWKYYGKGRQLHLLLCFQGEDLVGIIPAFTETLGWGPVGIRVAKLIGADFTLHLCKLPVIPDSLSPVVSHAIRYFFGKHRCDLILFGPLSGPAAQTDEILAAAKQESESVAKAETLGDSCNTYFHLPSNPEEYLKGLGKQHRSNYSRKMTQFTKSHRVAFDVVSDPNKVLEEFDRFQKMHDEQWRLEGKLGHFGDWPHALAFNRDLVQTLGAQGHVRFYRIWADNEVVSSQFSYVFGSTNYWRLPARACSEHWSRFSFGYMGLVKMFEDSMAEGFQTVEGGRGHYTYKLHLNGREWPMRTIQLTRKGSGASGRVRLFRSVAALFDIVYYKIIFARLAPRMSFFRRSLWPIWIRSNW
jgi:CelD/BcsL family acetyltransferase involved in cellulose biosynthesis